MLERRIVATQTTRNPLQQLPAGSGAPRVNQTGDYPSAGVSTEITPGRQADWHLALIDIRWPARLGTTDSSKRFPLAAAVNSHVQADLVLGLGDLLLLIWCRPGPQTGQQEGCQWPSAQIKKSSAPKLTERTLLFKAHSHVHAVDASVAWHCRQSTQKSSTYQPGQYDASLVNICSGRRHVDHLLRSDRPSQWITALACTGAAPNWGSATAGERHYRCRRCRQRIIRLVYFPAVRVEGGSSETPHNSLD